MPPLHLHPDVLVILGSLFVAYLLAWRTRIREVPAVEDIGRRKKIVQFSIGMAILLLAAAWPIHDLAEGALFSVHMFQHMLITLVAPAFMLAGTPEWMARQLFSSKPIMAALRVLTKPLVAFILFNALLLASHWPGWVAATVGSQWLHFGAHVLLFGSAVLMWWPIFSPLPEFGPISPPMQMVYLFLMSLAPTIPASFLTFGEKPMYAVYASFPRILPISVIEDQRIAGLLMKLGGGFILWGVIAYIFFKWYADEQHTPGWGEMKVHELERDVQRERQREGRS